MTEIWLKCDEKQGLQKLHPYGDWCSSLKQPENFTNGQKILQEILFIPNKRNILSFSNSPKFCHRIFPAIVLEPNSCIDEVLWPTCNQSQLPGWSSGTAG